ncbi:hypothetical protein ACSMXN_20380 [Jatrophihabitans sp. DSM 45814]
MTSSLLFERRKAVCVITQNRPHGRDLIDSEMAIEAALDTIEADGTDVWDRLAAKLAEGPPTSEDNIELIAGFVHEAGGVIWTSSQAKRRLAISHLEPLSYRCLGASEALVQCVLGPDS